METPSFASLVHGIFVWCHHSFVFSSKISPGWHLITSLSSVEIFVSAFLLCKVLTSSSVGRMCQIFSPQHWWCHVPSCVTLSVCSALPSSKDDEEFFPTKTQTISLWKTLSSTDWIDRQRRLQPLHRAGVVLKNKGSIPATVMDTSFLENNLWA